HYSLNPGVIFIMDGGTWDILQFSIHYFFLSYYDIINGYVKQKINFLQGGNKSLYIEHTTQDSTRSPSYRD
ncbi:hypothetical protein, partial [Priestia filamentosa]|uniref:hypothetical protein n=1 Tax=Priestia filamentosa TaxID=1402861 RepID=UPI0039827DF4